MRLSAASEFVLKTIKESGGEAYVVGGAVRNYFLGLPVGDFDVTSSFTPDKVLDVFSGKGCRVLETGLKHGTVTVRVFGESIEITSFRSDGKYSDGRHPEKVEFVGSIEEDLKRRDFTVNAMCFDGERFIDLFGGKADAERKIIRAIGDPCERFKEDALRILRALRFASQLGFTIEKDTEAALFAQKRLLLNLSSERIVKELKGILLGENVKDVLLKYGEIFAVILPEISPRLNFGRKTSCLVDGYTLSVLTCAAAEKDFVLRFAALMLCGGKSDTFSFGNVDAENFYGREEGSAAICERVADRLKFSSADKKRLVSVAAFHNYPVVPSYLKLTDGSCDEYILRALSRLGVQTVRDVLFLQRAEASVTSGETSATMERINGILSRLDSVLSDKKPFTVNDLNVDGNDVKSLGYKGREIGNALERLLSAVISGKVKNEKESLISFLKENNRFPGK